MYGIHGTRFVSQTTYSLCSTIEEKLGRLSQNRMLTKHNFPDNIEGLFVQLNFRKSKWLLGGMFHPPSQPDQYFNNTLDKALDVHILIMKMFC